MLLETLRSKTKYVLGPDGSALTIADLPAPGTNRRVIRRKAEVWRLCAAACSRLTKRAAATRSRSMNFFPGNLRSTNMASPDYAPHASSNIGRNNDLERVVAHASVEWRPRYGH